MEPKMQQKSNQFKKASTKTRQVSLDSLFKKIEALHKKWLRTQTKKVAAPNDELAIVKQLWDMADEYTTRTANPSGTVTPQVKGVYDIMNAAAARIKELGMAYVNLLRDQLNQPMDAEQELNVRIELNRRLSDSLKINWAAKPAEKKAISDEMAKNYTKMQGLARQLKDAEILSAITNWNCEACIGAALRDLVQNTK